VAKIEALYADLPESSEQVLHPKKYGRGGDYPHRVVLPDLTDLLPEGWVPGWADTIGELQVGVLLNEFRGGGNLEKTMRLMSLSGGVAFHGTAERASEGWDGDRVQSYYGPEGRTALVWVSRWDSKRDAREFAAAYREGLAYKKEQYGFDPAGAVVEALGSTVLVVEGFPKDAANALAEHLFEEMKIIPDRRDPKDVAALRAAVERKLRK
jgi:hypothetical protein